MIVGAENIIISAVRYTFIFDALSINPEHHVNLGVTSNVATARQQLNKWFSGDSDRSD